MTGRRCAHGFVTLSPFREALQAGAPPAAHGDMPGAWSAGRCPGHILVTQWAPPGTPVLVGGGCHGVPMTAHSRHWDAPRDSPPSPCGWPDLGRE